MSNEVLQLQQEIKRLYGCDSAHLESVAVVELDDGEPAWDGAIEVFSLMGCPTASPC
jgi:hypothetical protein